MIRHVPETESIISRYQWRLCSPRRLVSESRTEDFTEGWQVHGRINTIGFQLLWRSSPALTHPFTHSHSLTVNPPNAKPFSLALLTPINIPKSLVAKPYDLRVTDELLIPISAPESGKSFLHPNRKKDFWFMRKGKRQRMETAWVRPSMSRSLGTVNHFKLIAKFNNSIYIKTKID